VQPAKLNRRVEIRQFAASRAANGEQLETWSTVATRWGDLRYLKGDEQQVGNVETQEHTKYVCTLHYELNLSTMDGKWQLVIDGATYHITSVDNVSGLNRWLKVYCYRND